jgi:hypothetical protein
LSVFNDTIEGSQGAEGSAQRGQGACKN